MDGEAQVRTHPADGIRPVELVAPATVNQISEWLVGYISKAVEVDPDSIDVDLTFDAYTLSSVSLVMMTEDLSRWMGVFVEPEAPFAYATIRKLSEHLAQKRYGAL
jgi:acyl carrier protein